MLADRQSSIQRRGSIDGENYRSVGGCSQRNCAKYSAGDSAEYHRNDQGHSIKEEHVAPDRPSIVILAIGISKDGRLLFLCIWDPRSVKC
jgi:hypothetical protein